MRGIGAIRRALRRREMMAARLSGFLLALGVLGLVHLAAHRPDEPALWPTGGGAIGYVAATPLATGLTGWVADPNVNSGLRVFGAIDGRAYGREFRDRGPQ